LNKNELGGAIQKDLNNDKANVTKDIEGLRYKYNSYPTPEQLKEFNLEATVVILQYIIGI
jgi:hypothetical protein